MTENQYAPGYRACANCKKATIKAHVCSIECLDELHPSKAGELRKEIYWFILTHAVKHTYAPTLRTIADKVGSSISNIKYHVTNLAAWGLLQYDVNNRIVIPGAILIVPELPKSFTDAE